jgi:hypothetical protein
MRALILAAILLFPTMALAVTANDLRQQQRNATNTGSLAIDLPAPTGWAVLGYNPSSTYGRIDGGTGTYEVYNLGSGLNYDAGTFTVYVANVPQSSITGLSTSLAAKLDNPGGTANQYIKGDGTLGNFNSRTFNYPSRALNSCYQISSTRDADFHYKVDVSSGTLLSGTATGTVTATSYNDSGCSTGAQVVADGTASQGAALGVLSVSQIASVNISGMLPANKWMRITTAQTVGTPTFAIRAVQAETLLP